MSLFDSHRDAISNFLGRLVYNWTVAINTWNTTRYLEDEVRREEAAERDKMARTPHRPYKSEKVDLDMMALDTIELEEVGKDEGLVIYV